MVKLQGAGDLEKALTMVGELLEARGQSFRIVVIGGSALNLLGFVARATTDVDIIAFAGQAEGGILVLRPPDEPLPPDLLAAATVVAGDLGLDPDWMNAAAAGQWKTGLPPGVVDRIEWRSYHGLIVGLVSRIDLIFFKVCAAADHRGPSSVHFQDLMALRPTATELELAARWVVTQDPSPGLGQELNAMIEHARNLIE